MDEQIKKRAMEILDRLTLKEKIGQLNQDTGNTDNIDVLKEKIRRGEVGSLILATSATAGNDEQSKPLLEAINELQRVAVEESPSGIPIILGRDVIHGHETVLPVPLALSAGFNPQTIYEAYRCVAKEYFDAIFYSWHSGTYTAQSIADILYGKVNPSGKLPMTLPRCTGQIPIYYNYPGTCGEVETYYADKDNNAHYYHDDYTTPMYPFGYGLSYTQFEYSDIVCDRDEIPLSEIEAGAVFKISATVKNVGKYDGKEASQCYIRDEVGSMSRPRKELKGISKNMLKVGEEKRLTFELGFEELAFYNANKEFKPERGDFTIFIGGDCYADMSVGIKIV